MDDLGMRGHISYVLGSRVLGIHILGIRLLGIYVLGLLLGITSPGPLATAAQRGPEPIIIDDFESYDVGDLPTKWKYDQRSGLIPLVPELMHPDEQFYITEDRGNHVLRVHSEGRSVHIMMANEPDGFDWNLNAYPRLAWDWRALALPADAREDEERLNDSSLALYVIFSLDGLLFKRPKTIKYVYSSTLPVGTVVSYGKLKVVVVSSGPDQLGKWDHVERNIREDYRRIFGDDPPERPLSIRLWSDSDNTKEVAEGEFDNIQFLPPHL